MVVVDSSALIPLSWVGRLDLITAVFDDVQTTEIVEDEVLVAGKRGTTALERFLAEVTIRRAPDASESVATMAGIAVGDASVVLLAAESDQPLLANDRGLVTVARSHDVDPWWVTTLLLACANEGVLDANEANEVLYNLVSEGMNLSPQVYAKVQKKLEEVGK